MGSKFGLILSLGFIFLAFLFASDLINIQLLYTRLDAFSQIASYQISKNGEITSQLMEYTKSEINSEIKAANVVSSYTEGSIFEYYLIKEYKPIAFKSDPMSLKITRYAVINLYK